jgi:hypothetical protein
MTSKLLRCAVICAICFQLLTPDPPARADNLSTDAHEIIAGAVAIGIALGVGIFFAFHHGSSIKGCAAGGPGGLEIRNEGDQVDYLLSGDTSQVKAGDRVRVKGKKKSAKGSSAPATFIVNSFAKDYGACPATAAAHP